MDIESRFIGCIIGGAIGDAWGSAYENATNLDINSFYFPFGKLENITPKWQITDDTQLTLLTLQAMIEDENLDPSVLCKYFLKAYQTNQLCGIGSSTLMALQGLEVGGHWSQVSRKGEYAAGNGAAMRIAPLVFGPILSRNKIREITYITHQNEEAYLGALSIILALEAILTEQWRGRENLLMIISHQLPDSRIKDRLIQLEATTDINSLGDFGTSGYVVDSVPFAIAMASKVHTLGFESMLSTIIEMGGDTDTNCSIAGQIAGCLLGVEALPKNKLEQLKSLESYSYIQRVLKQFENQKWNI